MWKTQLPCNPSKGDLAHFGILQVNSLSTLNRNAVLRISINGVLGTVFADSGGSHSIAGETLYIILLQQGVAFEKTVISLSFADGIVTQKEVLYSYPLHRMDDLLNEAKPTPNMSTIDLCSGYHQVKVVAEDQDKTAFTCPFGIYKFTRMPFGLRNAPATF
ncbi:retrovirus-related Pol polyprotein from transposon 297 [Trichonephila clavipes]|nr:retrovirus-related Pol polyprotein from transposon 297 [Trichonephila clavipes]